MIEEKKNPIVEALKDPIVLGSIAVAGAAQNPQVGDVIKQAPEVVSAVISLVTFIISLFKKRK